MLQQMELYQDKFLPPSHPAYERVVNVANRLIESNQEIPQLQRTKWLVTVVNEPSITNAFVLPVSHLIFPAHCAKILLLYAYAHILCRVVEACWHTRNIQGESLIRGPKLLSMYIVEQHGFLVRKYWQTGSFKACQTAFRTEFGERRAPS